MKHLNYRLLAYFLAFWMLLSVPVQTVSALSMVEVNDYTSYSVTGEVTTQGRMPDDVIAIKLPTARSNVLDVKLDPNNVIRQMNNYKVEGKIARIGAGNVFFTNIDASTGDISLTRNSDRLQIVNKGNVPLTVKMSVTVNKNGNDFTFANTPAFTDGNGHEISGSALYLALTTGSIRTPVLPIMETDANGNETLTGYGATSTGWISNNEGAYYLTGNPSTNQYYYARSSNFAEKDFASTTFYMTAAINDKGWSTSMSDFSLTVTWNVSSFTYEKGPDTDPNAVKDVMPWADTLFVAANASDAADLYVNFGSGANKMSTITGIAYTTAGGNAKTISAADANLTIDGSYVSVPATPSLYSGSNWSLIMTGQGNSCRVPFFLKDTGMSALPNPEGDVSPSINVTKAASAQNEWVEMTVTLGPMTKVTSFTCFKSNEEELTTASNLVLEIDGTSVRFKAYSAAWNGSDWRLNLEDDNGGVASVYFDLKNTGTIEQPVVITTQKASDMNEIATFKVYMNNMTELTGIKYRKSNRSYATTTYPNTLIFPEFELPEVRAKIFSAIWNGDYPSLEFKNDNGETFSARCTVK